MKIKKQLGFTLLELLIVIAIMGILASVSYINLGIVKIKARDAQRISEVNRVRKAIEMYYMENDHYPAFLFGGHYIGKYELTSPPFVELPQIWGDLLLTLNLSADRETAFDTGIQDPTFNTDDWESNPAGTYQYMPLYLNKIDGINMNVVGSKPQGYRIRTKLENLNHPILFTSLTGSFLYYDEFSDFDEHGNPESAAHKDHSCTPELGYYCVGFQEFLGPLSGKPVIYLYPTEKTDIAVKVTTKKITKSIPDYNDGWNVTAYPDGTIINSEDEETYPYLFWEGPSYEPVIDRSKGFVINSNEIEIFLAEKLTAQGLEAKEYDEFIEYWAPRMQDKDYTYIYFMPQVDYDKLVPMEISPQPDTVIRVYMLYKSLDEMIKVEAQELSSPPRKGFTVVEWGGDLTELK